MSQEDPKAQRLVIMVQNHLQAGAPDLAYGVGSAACRQFPVHVSLLELTGLAAAQSGQLSAAIDLFERAYDLSSDNLRLAYNLATVHQQAGTFGRARSLLEQCIQADPSHAAAHANLGAVLSAFGELDSALSHLEQSVALGQDTPEVHTNRGNAMRDQGFVEKAIEAYDRAISLDSQFQVAHSNRLLCMNYSSRYTQRDILEAHQAWAQPLRPKRPQRAARYPNHDTVRIGYVSPDFRRHSCAYYLRGLFEHHDRSQFEVTAYYNGNQSDEVTDFFIKRADRWRSIASLTTKQVRDQILDDEIDILVDLAGHSAHNRLDIFSEPVAHAQVTYLGYPNTTGLAAMTHRLGDSITDPEPEHLVERLVQLPGCFLCYQPDDDAPPVQPSPHTERDYVTFGSFNLLTKLTDDVLHCWGKILEGVEGSRIFLKTKQFASATARRRVTSLLRGYGIAEERITLRSHVASLREHLALYGELDLALDPFPYNGTTTTCEALYMGVPVLTMMGDRHASRVGASLLGAMGYDTLVAKNQDDYIDRAQALGNQPHELQAMRQTLRQTMLSSTLCNPVHHTRTLEAAFKAMLTD